MRARRLAFPAALAIVSMMTTPASAYVPEDTPQRRAEAAARAMLDQPPARGPTAGVVVMRGGRILWSNNADVAMVPASITKLATTTAAALRFGPDHRFATRVLAPARAPTVPALYLVGGGDPTFSTEAYRQRRYHPRPTDPVQRPAFRTPAPTVQQLAARVAEAGIRVVAGDLIADESLHDGARTQPGWRDSYLGRSPSVSYLSALTINEARAGANRRTLVREPPIAAAEALRTALRQRGVQVIGRIRTGVAPAGAVEVARVESPPLADIIDFINRYSVNYHSELLLKNLGAAFGDAGTTQAGVGVVLETLEDLGVGVEGLAMFDGSGLSLLNRMTPRQVAEILHRMVSRNGPAWDALRASMPEAGGPGTLLRRMTLPPTSGNLVGKTGQVREVRAMAGWTTAADGYPVVYVAIFNGTPSPFSLTSPLDLFGRLVSALPWGR